MVRRAFNLAVLVSIGGILVLVVQALPLIWKPLLALVVIDILLIAIPLIVDSVRNRDPRDGARGGERS